MFFFEEIENYVLEKYSSHSKCFDHGSVWEQYIDQCRRKRRVNPQVAGCYQVFIEWIKSLSACFVFFKYECVSSVGIYVHIGKEKYLCEYSGQNLSISTIDSNIVYIGTIICPDCQIICGSLVCYWKFQFSLKTELFFFSESFSMSFNKAFLLRTKKYSINCRWSLSKILPIPSVRYKQSITTSRITPNISYPSFSLSSKCNLTKNK